MVQLQEDLPQIEATGTQLVGISYDSVEVLDKVSEQFGVTFALLSDTDSATIKAYGIHHQKGYSHPGTFLLDQDGTVRAALFLDGYRDRHENRALIDAAAR